MELMMDMEISPSANEISPLPGEGSCFYSSTSFRLGSLRDVRRRQKFWLVTPHVGRIGIGCGFGHGRDSLVPHVGEDFARHLRLALPVPHARVKSAARQ